jgi:hypothetical protein
MYVSAMGIDSSFICVRISVASGTCIIVGPVGISVSCDAYCCVVAVGMLRYNVVVACSVAAIDKLSIESEVVIVGGCRIGPFLIQLKISVTDDILAVRRQESLVRRQVFSVDCVQLWC